MNSERASQLLKFIEDDPEDPFLYYALALEYKEDSPEKAGDIFDQVLDRFPNYLPTYYHAAGFFAERGYTPKVEEIYQKGMSLATASGDHHALKELKSAYNAWKMDLDL